MGPSQDDSKTPVPMRMVPASGYTRRVATRHQRIQVPRDLELDRAIARGRSVLAPGAPSSKIVHELAIRGAAALDRDREAEDRARDFLIGAAEGNSGLDLRELCDVRDRAWR